MTMFQMGLMACLALFAVSTASAQVVTAVTGGTVIGAAGAPVANAVVVVQDGRIARLGPQATTTVPPNAAVIDAKGKYVVPGLADMHNHARSGSFRMQQNLETNLRVLLAHGFTTVFTPSLGTMEFAGLKTSAAADAAPFPRFFSSGPSITVKGDLLGAGAGSPTPGSPAEARAAVKNLKSAGVDAIKVMYDDLGWASSQRVPVMSNDVLTAVVTEAHREGLKVFAHVPMLDRAKDVLRAGVDGLLHGIVDKPVDKELIDLMIRNRAVYVPTMAMYEAVADPASFGKRQSAYDERGVLSPLADSFTAANFVQQFQSMLDNTAFTKSRLPIQRANLKAVFDAGVPIVMGTDSGFPGVLMGISSQLELALMVEAGLTTEAALRSATINASRMLGREKDAGSVEAGKLADLVILDANPLEDIRNVGRIHRVIRGGTVHDPAQLLSGFKITAPPRPPGQ